jgi:hypothetical protein
MSQSKSKRKRSSNGTKKRVAGQWDLLNNTFNSLVNYAKLPTEIAPVLRSQEAMRAVEDQGLLLERARTLTSDCTVMAQQLLEIKAEHRECRGHPRHPDQMIKCIDLHQRYVDWAEQYEAVVYPTYLAINEQIGQAVGVDIMALRPTEIDELQPETDTDTTEGPAV